MCIYTHIYIYIVGIDDIHSRKSASFLFFFTYFLELIYAAYICMCIYIHTHTYIYIVGIDDIHSRKSASYLMITFRIKLISNFHLFV